MRYWLENDMRPVELAREACRQIGIEPFSTPIRGGTDGSRLTEMGVPDAQPLHRHAEHPRPAASGSATADMAAAVRLCIRLAELWGAGDGLTAPLTR